MLLAIGLGGMLGTLCRYALTCLPVVSYISLMIINGLGCFFMGFVLDYPMDSRLKEVLSNGFISAFTTYSTLIVFTEKLYHRHFLMSFGYILVALFFGFLCLYLGSKIAMFFS